MFAGSYYPVRACMHQARLSNWFCQCVSLSLTVILLSLQSGYFYLFMGQRAQGIILLGVIET